VFTGLIQATGTIASLAPGEGTLRLGVHAPTIAARLRTGDSVAVSGVCLTALDISSELFHAELAEETIARTSLSALAAGSLVNLELPTPAGAPLGGHIVQGHVDATGTLLALEAVALTAGSARTDWWLRVSVPLAVAPFVVEKGSIAIEGISLTVARWNGKDELAVAVIPHTYEATNLHSLSAGSPVNLEADVLMKLARQQPTPEPRFLLTREYLIANGY
jgi:riboflavin synthase